MAKKSSRKGGELPLFLHRNGQWCKKVKGKFHYFGTDKDQALIQWATDRDRILAGLPPRCRDNSPTVAELANVYLELRRSDIARGEITERTLLEAEKSIRRLVDIVGRDAQPSQMDPEDFATIRDKLAEPVAKKVFGRGGGKGRSVARRSPVTVDGDIRRLRAFFSWCVDNGHLPREPFYGSGFKTSSTKVRKQQRKKSNRHLFYPQELRSILAKTSWRTRPLILLAINAGLSVVDIGTWKKSEAPNLDLAEVWVSMPRRKTGIDRKFVLWPETVDAIRVYLRKQKANKLEALFLTARRQPWLRESGSKRLDALGPAFRKLREAAGLSNGAFYDLRRTFRTIAGESLDIEATEHVMGHADGENDMSARYRLKISDDRIRNVCFYVRNWLFDKKEE